MPEAVFFYGTLMTGFRRRNQADIDKHLSWLGRGWIQGALFDLGLYPAAVPSPDGKVWGEVYLVKDAAALAALDLIEGYSEENPDNSLYTREQVPVTLDDGGRTVTAWVYFYNAPMGRAERIPSGDYLDYVKVR